MKIAFHIKTARYLDSDKFNKTLDTFYVKALLHSQIRINSWVIELCEIFVQ